jgi:hypothetical protein
MVNSDFKTYLAFAAATVALILAARRWAAAAEQLSR